MHRGATAGLGPGCNAEHHDKSGRAAERKSASADKRKSARAEERKRGSPNTHPPKYLQSHLRSICMPSSSWLSMDSRSARGRRGGGGGGDVFSSSLPLFFSSPLLLFFSSSLLFFSSSLLLFFLQSPPGLPPEYLQIISGLPPRRPPQTTISVPFWRVTLLSKRHVQGIPSWGILDFEVFGGLGGVWAGLWATWAAQVGS